MKCWRAWNGRKKPKVVPIQGKKVLPFWQQPHKEEENKREELKKMTMPTMYTINQASAATGLSYEFLRKLCLQKKIVFIRTGTKYLINMGRLKEYLDKGEAD